MQSVSPRRSEPEASPPRGEDDLRRGGACDAAAGALEALRERARGARGERVERRERDLGVDALGALDGEAGVAQQGGEAGRGERVALVDEAVGGAAAEQ